MRWFHESIDRLQAATIRAAMPQALRHGTTSPSLREHLDAVRLSIPPLTTCKRYRLTADTLVGPLACGYRVQLGSRPGLPVLIYHHGIAEMPYDKSFRGIFGWRAIDAHLVVLQAPFHQTWWTVSKGLTTMSRFMAMCAVSVTMMEALRRRFHDDGSPHCLIAGLSLGGFLSLMHHLHVGTANRYAPLLSGPDIAHTMLATPFGRLLAPEAKAQAEHIQSLLDFRQAFQASDTRHIFPLLARYDLHMPYDHLYPCYLDSQVPVTMLNRGHITGSLSFHALRNHLLSCLEPLRQTATTGAQPENISWFKP
ncbi:MAG: hypothetical protein ETSY1_02275 [Candidatus Entotheonella factor]|uniref:Uncharacterized protein n=1 Tax=Entotheonella factor TaxID=1429438 RepID=W4LY36_ENTF1|nr:hypothetical protein [Candidatus Entotheonella palauensis]ETX02793.1 MAG: hypothetical protein ETSY1_02275 [Candidatus Entotheonella factor]